MTWKDILKYLRPRTVPSGYKYHTWKPGLFKEIFSRFLQLHMANISGQKEEDETDMLRSILSQLEFTYLIRQYDAQGVPFCSHLHVPEVHPITKSVFCEREDPGHVLKVQ